MIVKELWVHLSIFCRKKKYRHYIARLKKHRSNYSISFFTVRFEIQITIGNHFDKKYSSLKSNCFMKINCNSTKYMQIIMYLKNAYFSRISFIHFSHSQLLMNSSISKVSLNLKVIVKFYRVTQLSSYCLIGLLENTNSIDHKSFKG